jgi:hypothetical protein
MWRRSINGTWIKIMLSPLPRLSLKSMMILIALIAVGFSFDRFYFGLSWVFFAFLPIFYVRYRTDIETGKLILRKDARNFSRAYFFGVFMPVVCLVFDPIVFSDLIHDPRYIARLGGYSAYAFIIWQILHLTAWLARNSDPLQSRHYLLATLATGAVFAGILGLVLLPISVIGIIFIIGILGFTPLVTSFVYFHAALQITRLPPSHSQSQHRALLLVTGIFLSLAIPLAIGVVLTPTTPPVRFDWLLEMPDDSHDDQKLTLRSFTSSLA